MVPLQLTSQFSSASSSTIRPPDPSLVPFASSDDRYALSPVHEFLHTDHRLLLDPEGLSFFFIVVGTDCRRGERQARQRPQATQQQKWEGRVMWGAGWWVVGRMGCREMERGREGEKERGEKSRLKKSHSFHNRLRAAAVSVSTEACVCSALDKVVVDR